MGLARWSTAVLSQLFPLEESEYTNALAPRKYPRQANSVAPRYDHTHIETIDVTCDQKNGMFVTIEFESDFQGIIYSQGYFNDPKCRYVTPGRGGRQFSFTVPFNGCGSKPSCSVCSSVDNVLVIQSDEDVQEAWDTARRISCSQVEQQQNTIFFKPFVVDMLEVVNVPTATGGVECWMDIQRGSYPSISPIPSIIKIGEALSILVYLRDPRGEYDVSVRDCYAYDSPDYDAQGTKRLQLSDKNGCSRKKKLFGQWQKTTQTGTTGATLIVHNDIKAFKFPDRMQVFLKCYTGPSYNSSTTALLPGIYGPSLPNSRTSSNYPGTSSLFPGLKRSTLSNSCTSSHYPGTSTLLPRIHRSTMPNNCSSNNSGSFEVLPWLQRPTMPNRTTGNYTGTATLFPRLIGSTLPNHVPSIYRACYPTHRTWHTTNWPRN
ncbi:hypothetical protein pipiens_003961 [Culex pipiens pipiens]|uniref:ZP domain-containing protein n=1 Tax=Culex pipiens pipiens TaxID=38569 RepID=A0ABD1CQ59_CULPP